MIRFKPVASSVFACTLFAGASCMARPINQPEPSYASNFSPDLPMASRAKQMKRCEDLGRYVNLVASARDAGEPAQHFINRFQLNSGTRVNMYQGALPAHTWAAGGTALVEEIYARNASPGDWQQAMTGVCEKKIVG